MAKIGRKGRLWLRGFHVLFIGIWIGTVINSNIIKFSAENATDSGALYGYYSSLMILNPVFIVSTIGTLITGVFLAWLTPWRFFKYKWVIYSETIFILALIIAMVWIDPSVSKVTAIVKAEGMGACQSGAASVH